jgi:hypothetical protein
VPDVIVNILEKTEIEIPELHLKLRPIAKPDHIYISQFGVEYYLLIGWLEIVRDRVEGILSCGVHFDGFRPCPRFLCDEDSNLYDQISYCGWAKTRSGPVRVWLAPKEQLDDWVTYMITNLNPELRQIRPPDVSSIF